MKLKINIKQDILSYLLITGQIVVILIDFKYSLIIALLIFVAIIAVNFKSLKPLAKMAAGMIKYKVR